jgi:transposase
MEAPVGFECPYRHNCPHLDRLSTTWAMEVYQESAQLRRQCHALEEQYQQRISELEKTLSERDAKIAQLRVQHQKQFKANAKPVPPPARKPARKRGAPIGHPPWRRREPDHINQTVEVPAPKTCPHCQCKKLSPHPEVYKHLQEDIVLVPRTHVTCYVHGQSYCPGCRRPVYQAGQGELPGCSIGPVTRAVGTHLRYDLQIPYRKVQHILRDLFGMPLTPASAMAFDRKAAARGQPLYEELQAKLKSSEVAYADETTWRENGQRRYVWFGGNLDVAVYQITDNRSADSAVQLLGDDFDGTLVTDAYGAYNAVNARRRQTCWSHIAARSKEILQQIELTRPPIAVPRSVAFCKALKKFASRLCDLGRQLRHKKLKRAQARAMIPSLERQLKRFAGRPLDYEPAETLRDRIMNKDHDKLFTFLRVPGVEPTNNHSERSVRFLVIMRKISFGTRSEAGSQAHSVLPSLLETARRQGKDRIRFLTTLMTQPQDAARAALFANTSCSSNIPDTGKRQRPNPARPERLCVRRE